MSKIPKIHSLLDYVECIREIGTADNTDTKICEAAYKNHIKNSYHSSKNIEYSLQPLGWEMCLFHIKSKVFLLLHIGKSDHVLPKTDICRLLLLGKSLASNGISPSLMACTNRVIRKCSMISIPIFLEGISILEYIDNLSSHF
jgi:hypothetical protein